MKLGLSAGARVPDTISQLKRMYQLQASMLFTTHLFWKRTGTSIL
ncbi:hypothetical protein [Kroppenstedtia pulmonis]|nr:hypothetical protein [Kroppenstedtia pulmonis]